MADKYHEKREDTKTSRKKLDRNAEYDKENRTIVACKVSKDKASAFKTACYDHGTTPNEILLLSINTFMQDPVGYRIAKDRIDKFLFVCSESGISPFFVFLEAMEKTIAEHEKKEATT